MKALIYYITTKHATARLYKEWAVTTTFQKRKGPLQHCEIIDLSYIHQIEQHLHSQSILFAGNNCL